MTFKALHAQYLLAVRDKDQVEQASILQALHKLAKTNSTLPAWVIALGIVPAATREVAVTTTPGPPPPSALERAIAAAKAQRALTPSAFGTVDDAALDSALALNTVMHGVAAQAVARLTAAAAALRAAGAESSAHVAWRAKSDAIQAEIAQAQSSPPMPAGAVALVAALASAIPKEPPYDLNGGRASEIEHAIALGAVVALLG